MCRTLYPAFSGDSAFSMQKVKCMKSSTINEYFCAQPNITLAWHSSGPRRHSKILPSFPDTKGTSCKVIK